MKKILLYFCLLLALKNLSAQTLSPSVIATSGESFSNASGSLSFTACEMVMIETFSNSSGSLLQGFQHGGNNIVTAITDPAFPGLTIKIFPNPSDGRVNFFLNAPSAIKILVELFDNLGRKVSAFQIRQSQGQQIYAYDWQKLSAGIYIIKMIISNEFSYNTTTHSSKIYITH